MSEKGFKGEKVRDTAGVPCLEGDAVYYLLDPFSAVESCTVVEVEPYGEVLNGVLFNAVLKNNRNGTFRRVRFDEFGKTVFSTMDEVNKVRDEVVNTRVKQMDSVIKDQILQCKRTEDAMNVVFSYLPFGHRGSAEKVYYILVGMFGLYLDDTSSRTGFDNCRLLLQWVLNNKNGKVK